jgi:hypothetical protein
MSPYQPPWLRLRSALFENDRWTWMAILGVVFAVAGNWPALRAANVRPEK